MYGALGNWGWPDADKILQFEAEYNENYLPLVRKVPHVVDLDLYRADESGKESDIYRIGAMWFEDEEHYAKASESPEWEAMFAYCDALVGRYDIKMGFAYVRRE